MGMDWKFIRDGPYAGRRRVPDTYFLNFISPGFARAPKASWVTARFSPAQDEILYLGGDGGHIGVMDASRDEEGPIALKHCFQAHPGAVMDVVGVPTRPNELLSMSGDDIILWTMGETMRPSLFLGHDKSVRCASFAPDNPHVFATGGRDGSVIMWDRRLAPVRQEGHEYRRPVKEYKNCHQIRNARPSSASRRRSDRLSIAPPPPITSLVHLDDHIIITASTHSASGLRMWDTRRMPLREESRPMEVFELPSEHSGISSLSLDRFASALFAASMDNCVYEFAVRSACFKPVRSYVGAHIKGDFYTQVACSPTSDHILCGSTNQALVWDVQRFHTPASRYARDFSRPSWTGIRPSLRLGGHDSRVATVGWSCKGTYMVTMDDSDFRIWRAAEPSGESVDSLDESRGSGFERVEKVEPTKEEQASSILDSCFITPGPQFLSPVKGSTSLKRKEPFKSPFKPSSVAARAVHEMGDRGKENIAPGSKLFRLEEPDSESDSVEGEKVYTGAAASFRYKYCTMNLPNRVYERYLADLRKARQPAAPDESPTVCASRKPRAGDWFRMSDGDRLNKTRVKEGESPPCVPAPACSQMHSSPRKLNVRVATAAPSSAPPKAIAPTTRRSARNLLHYMNLSK